MRGKIKFICVSENISLFRFSAMVRLGAAKRKEKKSVSVYILLEHKQKSGEENGRGEGALNKFYTERLRPEVQYQNLLQYDYF